MAVQLQDGIGSGYMAQVTDENRLKTTTQLESVQTGTQNYAMELQYSGTQISQVTKLNSAGSFVKLLQYSGASLISVGSWT